MTLGSFFDGIGGWQLAARRAGILPIWSSEIEKFPLAVTRMHFPDTIQLGDITKINPERLPAVDIICAGSPCQDLSIAGTRSGLNGTRSGLFRTAISLFHELRRRTGKPRFFVWENVPGAFSSNGGRDFRAVLQEVGKAKIPMPPGNRWATAGVVELPRCQIAWRTLDAQFFGVAQRRRRIFLVADFARGERRAAQILFECQGVPGDHSEGDRARQAAPGVPKECPHDAGSATVLKIRQPKVKGRGGSGAQYQDDKSYTISTHQDQTLFDWREAKEAGASTLTPWDKQNRRIQAEEGKSQTILAGEKSGLTIPPVFRSNAQDFYDTSHRAEAVRKLDDKSNTLPARMGTGGGNVPICHSYGIAGNIINREIQNGGNGIGFQEEKSYTLTRMDRHAICIGNGQPNSLPSTGEAGSKAGTLNRMHSQQMICYGYKNYSDWGETSAAATLKASGGSYGGGSASILVNADKVGALCASDAKGVSNQLVDANKVVAPVGAVRYLTPLECERLQGLPDHYTNIDDKTCSDSARYKAIGNGMAQPCADFVLKRIALAAGPGIPEWMEGSR